MELSLTGPVRLISFPFLKWVTGLVDHRDAIDIVNLDFSKAFDRIPHDALIASWRAVD